MRRELKKDSLTASRKSNEVIFTGVQMLYAVQSEQEQLVETSEFRRHLMRKDGEWIILSEETRPATNKKVVKMLAQATWKKNF